MTTRFLKFIPFILKWETEYNKDGSVAVERDPDDPGGTTKYGIDQRSHPKVNIEKLTKEQATAIYFDEWTKQGIERMATKLGECYFNCSVNCGLGRANKLRAQSKDANTFIVAQEAYYRRLVAFWASEGKKRPDKYLAGWLNRTHALRSFLKVG